MSEKRDQKANSDANVLGGNGKPQAPASIPVETADKASNNIPYNKGGEPHGVTRNCGKASL